MRLCRERDSLKKKDNAMREQAVQGRESPKIKLITVALG